jgi:phage tail-like protein
MNINKKDYPALGFNFKVTSTFSWSSGVGIAKNLVFGPDEAFFQSVSGIGANAGEEPIANSGINNRQYKLPKATSYTDLVLTRGVVKSSSEMGRWCRAFLVNDGFFYGVERKTVNVMLLDSDSKTILMTWSFYDCYPKEFEIGAFNAEESKIAIETLKLAYSHFSHDISGEFFNPLNYLK